MGARYGRRKQIKRGEGRALRPTQAKKGEGCALRPTQVIKKGVRAAADPLAGSVSKNQKMAPLALGH